MTKKVVVRENPSAEIRKNLSKFSDIVSRILFHRGLSKIEDVEPFLDPDYELHTNDPFLLKDMEKAVARIFSSIQNNEKVCIYSDYDADGIPGAVIVHDFFKKIGYENFINYIPHRVREGFGLNNSAIKEIVDSGTKLIITVDCGISDVEQVNFANSLGVDVIITDHHEIGKEIPDAFAIINPKQSDCNYPEKMLCGSGVVFKLIQAMISKGSKNSPDEKSLKIFDFPVGYEKWFLDMVGIATLSDMVPLVRENRVLAKYGLMVLRKTRRPGLLKLFRENYLSPNNVSEDDVGFTIAPRINAASRMGEPDVAFKLLSTSDEVEAGEALKHLHKINNERRGVVAAIVKEIKKFFDEKISLGDFDKKVIVKGNPDWSPSLLGLAANSIVECYKRPVFLWGRGEGSDLKGSCRSDGSVNLVELMKNVSPQVIETFGGHEMAGGFVVSEKDSHNLEDELSRAYDIVRNGNELDETIYVDAALSPDDISWSFFDELKVLSPFGTGNEKPLFLFEAEISGLEKFGKAKEHTKIIFKKSKGEEIQAIKFYSDGLFDSHKIGDKIKFTSNLEKSFFGRKPELRLRIEKII